MAKRVTLTERTERWLRELLADGPVAATEVQRRVDEAGWITVTTLRRAKERVGVVSQKARGRDGAWTWALPDEDE